MGDSRLWFTAYPAALLFPARVRMHLDSFSCATLERVEFCAKAASRWFSLLIRSNGLRRTWTFGSWQIGDYHNDAVNAALVVETISNSRQSMTDRSNWFEDFFHGVATDLWRKVGTPELTRADADFFEKTLGKKKRLLDVPCGNGRHSLELARRGCRVTGLDISKERKSGNGGIGSIRRARFGGCWQEPDWWRANFMDRAIASHSNLEAIRSSSWGRNPASRCQVPSVRCQVPTLNAP